VPEGGGLAPEAPVFEVTETAVMGDAVRADRTFVAAVTAHQGVSMMRTFVRLGRWLGVSEVAQGVDDGARLRIVTDEGCDKDQGYLFSMPVDLERLRSVVRHRTATPRVEPPSA